MTDDEYAELMTKYKDAYDKIRMANAHACPNCGYCPHCGRGGGYFGVPYYPNYPGGGTYYPHPYGPWVTYTVSNNG